MLQLEMFAEGILNVVGPDVSGVSFILMVSTPTRFSKVLGTDSLLLTHLAGFAVDTTFPGV